MTANKRIFAEKKLKEKFLKLCENSHKTHRVFAQNSLPFKQNSVSFL